MNKELDKKLCAEFPLIFADRYKDPSQTCMYWGFDCGDGWYNIIRGLCLSIQSHIDGRKRDIEWTKEWNARVNDPDHEWTAFVPREEREVKDEIPQVVAVQVKEKYGTLRFYINGGDDTIYALIDFAELMSGVTCEVCGKPGARSDGGWISTLCSEHSE